LSTHAPVALQYADDTQSVSVVHVVLQLVAPQLNGAQFVDAGAALQVPVPLHSAAPVEIPPMQVAAVHTTEVEG
jgi:hypothetical protein